MATTTVNRTDNGIAREHVSCPAIGQVEYQGCPRCFASWSDTVDCACYGRGEGGVPVTNGRPGVWIASFTVNYTDKGDSCEN